MEQRHVPVLLERCVELLAPALDRPGAVLVDATLGMGGHTEALLERLPRLRVVGLDRDPQAIALASQRLARFGDRFTAVHAVYDDVLDVVADVVGRPVQGLLMDLGVSSLQLDEADRGFAYAQDAPLDMRMDPTTGLERRRPAGHRRRARARPDPAASTARSGSPRASPAGSSRRARSRR